jgi:RND family efflux transporter MFP subunit
MKKLLTFFLLAAFIFGGWWTVQKVRQDQAQRAPEIKKTTTVELATIEDVINLTGVVQPVVSTEVKSEVTGRIETVEVRNGQAVKRGDFLLQLAKQERLSELREAERNYEAFQLRLERARRDYEREQELKEKGFTNEKSYLDARTDLEIAEIDLTVREARLEKSRETLAKTTILAPHDGIVSHLDLTPGQVIVGATSVNEGTVLMKINDPTRLYVSSDVTEIDINKLRHGMEAGVSFDALAGEEFTGQIAAITNYAEEKENQRVFGVQVTFEALNKTIRQGITANVTVPLQKVEDVPALLLSSIFLEEDRSFVYVELAGGEFEKREVETGLRNAFNVQILSGVEVGEQVSLIRPSAMADNPF